MIIKSMDLEGEEIIGMDCIIFKISCRTKGIVVESQVYSLTSEE